MCKYVRQGYKLKILCFLKVPLLDLVHLTYVLKSEMSIIYFNECFNNASFLPLILIRTKKDKNNKNK